MESIVKTKNYYYHKRLGRGRERYVCLLLTKDRFGFPHTEEPPEEQGGV